MQLDYSAMLVGAAIPHLVWFLPALVAVAALKALLPRFSGWAGEMQVGARLNRLFPEVRHDLILPDGRGGLTQIDHLALTPAGLLVVETKTYSGSILGQSNESTWTQALGRQRHRFQNPLRQNFAHVRAIEALVPDVPVEGRVVFAGKARFPKGMPEGVCHASELRDELEPLRQGEVSPLLRAAWEQVLAASRTDRAARKEHLRGLQARYGGVRSTWAPVLLLAGSVLWLTGLWFYDHPAMPWREVQTSMPTSFQGFSAALVPRPMAAKPSAHPPVSVRPAPPQTGRGPKVERQRSERGATIEWEGPKAQGSDKDACAIATAAVLIENTAENRRTRDRACGLAGAR
jgi:hypothetical protein